MLKLTDAAASKAAELRTSTTTGEAANGNGETALRIAVQPGGCAGLRYDLYFDNTSLDGDTVTSYVTPNGTLNVVVDTASASYLDGATVDYVERIDKMGFVVDNPAATGGCACGDSFC